MTAIFVQFIPCDTSY